MLTPLTPEQWYPAWYRPEDLTRWNSVKNAVRRDWQQTKHDLHAGGHELNQAASDTIKQATGREAVPAIDKPNPPKVIGELDADGDAEWAKMERAMEYGYTARTEFAATHAEWNHDLDLALRREWESSGGRAPGLWDDVKPYVRHGYNFRG
jgi:hypothetical protein